MSYFFLTIKKHSNQGCGVLEWKQIIFYGSGSTLMKEAGCGSKSVEYELELEVKAIFSKSGTSRFSNWL